MKQAKSITKYLIASMFAVLACAFAVPASAATYTHNIAAGDENIPMKSAYSVEKVVNAVIVVASDGSARTYPDASGALYAKMQNYMATTGGSWFRIPGTQLDLNVTEAKRIACNSSTGDSSYFLFPNNYLKFYYDGCAAKNALNAGSN